MATRVLKACLACSRTDLQARGLCGGHYKQWQRGATTFTPLRVEKAERLGVRFVATDEAKLEHMAKLSKGLSFYELANELLDGGIRRAPAKPHKRWRALFSTSGSRRGATKARAMGLRLSPARHAQLKKIAAGHGLSVYSMANELLARAIRRRYDALLNSPGWVMQRASNRGRLIS